MEHLEVTNCDLKLGRAQDFTNGLYGTRCSYAIRAFNSDVAIAANIAIMRAFVQVRKYLLAASNLSAELRELRAKVDLLELRQEENLGAVNDLSEDVRKELDSLYLAIGDLSIRIEEKKNQPRKRIGF